MMIIVNFPSDNERIDSVISISVCESKAEVASSKNKMSAPEYRERAMQIRCFCPPDSFAPPLAYIIVFGKVCIKSQTLACHNTFSNLLSTLQKVLFDDYKFSNRLKINTYIITKMPKIDFSEGTYVLTQLATRHQINVSYSHKYILQDSFMGDYGFFSHFRISLFKF